MVNGILHKASTKAQRFPGRIVYVFKSEDGKIHRLLYLRAGAALIALVVWNGNAVSVLRHV